VLAAAAAPAVAAPMASDPLAALSGGSPFAHGCGTGATTQRGAETEAHLAVAPRDPARLVAAWQQDRYRTAGTLATGVSMSANGGRTWRRVDLPGTTTCPAGGFDRTSDPWVSIGADGTAYLSTVPGRIAKGSVVTKVVVNRSLDGGATWSGPVVVADRGGFEDKESVTADPVRPATAYVVWGAVEGGNGRTAWFARTVDGGATWSAPRPIYTPGARRADVGHVIAVAPDGALVDVFLDAPTGPGAGAVMAMRSQDQGSTWSPPVPVGVADGVQVEDAEKGTPVSNGGSLPSVAVAPDGTLFVSWQTAFSPQGARIVVARSSDGGRSFGPPGSVAGGRGIPFTPVVAASAAGVAVSYLDFRFDRRGDRELTTSAWIAHSHDAGRSWTETRLGAPFDLRRAPKRGSGGELFLGDYAGLVPLADGFGAALVESRPAATRGPSDVLFAHARLGKTPRALRVLASLRPRRVRAGRRVRVRVLIRGAVDGRRPPLADAVVRLGGRRVTTNAKGRASLAVKLPAGRYRVRATKPGFRAAVVTLRVRSLRASAKRRR
jgi:hypothetical protein